MKVLMISRANLYTAPGGDTIQIVETASHLRKIGVEVDVKLTNEVIDYDQYTIVHFFNVIRPADILSHTQYIKGKYVISPIFVDYEEYEKEVRTGLLRYVNKLFSSNFIEYLKVVARVILNGEKVKSKEYLLIGHKAAIKKIIKSSSLLLPNSNNEYLRLLRKFGIEKDYIVVPNAISTEKFQAIPSPEEKEGVLCVARFEPLKNQLNLIRAINKTTLKLTLIGKASPNSQAFYDACKMEAAGNANIQFIEFISQDELLKFYNKAKVHVLASWFETTGLSSLEAAACGCNLVITDKGDTREYFGDDAFYCNPDDIDNILETVKKAMSAPNVSKLKDLIFKKYIWEETARQTLLGYRKIGNEK